MATAEYYDPTEIATRILPHLVVLTVDSDGYCSSFACLLTIWFFSVNSIIACVGPLCSVKLTVLIN